MSRSRSVLLAVMAVLALSGCGLLFPVIGTGPTEPSPVVVQVTAAP